MTSSIPLRCQVTVKERTHREAIPFRLEWTIENFKIFKDQTDYMCNSGITMKDLGPDVSKEYEGRWRIGVRPCWKVGKTKYVSIYLWFVGVIKGKKLCADFRTSVNTGKTMDAAIFSASASDVVFSEEGESWGYSKIVEHTRLLGAKKGSGVIKDNCITIVMDVVMYKKEKTVKVPEIGKPHPDRLLPGFTRRQLEWLHAEHHRQFLDLILVSNDNKEFHVHRFALMTHSPVFEAMFTHDLKEKRLSRCVLEDIDSETVEILLDFVYGCDTGKVNSKNAEKVLIMADKYDIADLRTFCEPILLENIPVERAVHYLVLAAQRGLIKLKGKMADWTSSSSLIRNCW